MSTTVVQMNGIASVCLKTGLESCNKKQYPGIVDANLPTCQPQTGSQVATPAKPAQRVH